MAAITPQRGSSASDSTKIVTLYLNALEKDSTTKTTEVFEKVIKALEQLATLGTKCPGRLECLDGISIDIDKLKIDSVKNLIRFAKTFILKHANDADVDTHLLVAALNSVAPALNPLINPHAHFTHSEVAPIEDDIAKIKHKLIDDKKRPPIFQDTCKEMAEQYSKEQTDTSEARDTFEKNNAARVTLNKAADISGVTSLVGAAVALVAPAVALVGAVVAIALDIILLPIEIIGTAMSGFGLGANTLMFFGLITPLGPYALPIFLVGAAIFLIAGGIWLGITLTTPSGFNKERKEHEEKVKTAAEQALLWKEVRSDVQNPGFQEFAFFFKDILKRKKCTEAQAIIPFYDAYKEFIKKRQHQDIAQAVKDIDKAEYESFERRIMDQIKIKIKI